MILVVVAVACGRGDAPPAVEKEVVTVVPADAATDATPQGDAAQATGASGASSTGAAGTGLASAPLAYPAIRCSECHNKMFDEWKTSAHAKASTSAAYQRMRAHAKEPGCDGCHAPLAAHLPPGDRVSAEGVTCEVCHNIKDVEVRRQGGAFELRLTDNIKYGPLCDAEDHYFHKMGCSPLHQQSKLCAACHLYYRPLPGGGELPVLTEFEEWREGPSKGRACQSCHMPGTRAEVAEGAGERDGVSNHGLLGATGDLRRRALRGKATVRAQDGALRVEVELRNMLAGHYVPTGLPEKRVIVRAVAKGAEGATVASAEHRIGRVLVDAQGRPAPFYKAVKVASDDRIGPKQSRKVILELATAVDVEVEVEVVWRAIDAEIAKALRIDDVEEQSLLRATLDLQAASGRPSLPQTIELQKQ